MTESKEVSGDRLRQANTQQLNCSQDQSKKKAFRKCHRRAFSVPSSAHKTDQNGAPNYIQIGAEAFRDGCYHLGYRKRVELDINKIEVLEYDEDDDFEMPINEEELMQFRVMEEEDVFDHSHPHRKFWQLNWRRVNFSGLPSWLQDNEYLQAGHRAPMPSLTSCFKSIFSLHTETGNIFTHMYGCIAFIGISFWFLTRPESVISWKDKSFFAIFFLGAITCMGLSFAFHTVSCHSEDIYRIFCKLDYAGISLLIVGSFVPWINYGFYCRTLPKCIYISMIVLLGIPAFIMSLWDKFSGPTFRPIRAFVFMAMGLSSIAPALHLALTDGFIWMFEEASFHWLVLMGLLYIFGALIYVFRVPERCFPGKFDIWFQSHQLFHLFVVAAALVHFYGLVELAKKRLEGGTCSEQLESSFGTYQSFTPWLDKYFRPY